MIPIGSLCARCRTDEHLTKHHIKKDDIKTGEIMILCRSCHNLIERDYHQYKKLGIIPLNRFIPFFALSRDKV